MERMAVQGSNLMGWSDTYEPSSHPAWVSQQSPHPCTGFQSRPSLAASASSPRLGMSWCCLAPPTPGCGGRDPGEILMDGCVGGGRSLPAREVSMHGKGARRTPAGTAPQPVAAPHPRSALTTMALGLSRSPRSTTPMASPLSRWTLMVLVASHVQNSVRL